MSCGGFKGQVGQLLPMSLLAFIFGRNVDMCFHATCGIFIDVL